MITIPPPIASGIIDIEVLLSETATVSSSVFSVFSVDSIVTDSSVSISSIVALTGIVIGSSFGIASR